MDIFKKCKEYTFVNEVKAMGIYPYFHALESRPDSEVIMEGKRRIMLGSNNYLGLTVADDVIKAGEEALEQYGTGCSGSRFLNGTLDMHITLEKELAAFLRQEDVCTFSTGFQSNLGIISAVAGRNDVIICDRENHASIYDGCRLSYAQMLRFRHSDMEGLEKILQSIPEDKGKLIVTDGVFSMRGDIAKLPEIVELAKKYGARVMVDDAHGLGVIGEGGRGTPSHFGLEKEVDIYMGTFSKSLASLGGYMAADHCIVDYVRHHSRPFIFSASITPSSCATALAALRHLEANPDLPKKLADLADFFRSELQKRNVRIDVAQTPIIPIYTTEAIATLKLSKKIYEMGVYTNPVLPPATPENECLLRTSCMATHTKPLLAEAAEIIAKAMQE